MSFWGTSVNAIALVELLETGEIPQRREQEQAWAALLELGWARRARRSGTLVLDSSARSEIEKTLTHAWPPWREMASRLAKRSLALSPTGLRELKRQERLEGVGELDLPTRMNRRTAAAVLGAHSKAVLGPLEDVALDGVDVTDDGLIRLRPSAGLEVECDGQRYDARRLAAVLGELVLTDRSLRDGTRLTGEVPRAVLTVENLGAYQDACVPIDVLVVHLPGWNTRSARDLLDGIAGVPVLHFGDLDPDGVKILAHLRRWRSQVRWLVPSFWREHVDTRGLSREWPDIEMPADAPDWVRELPKQELWLEQEAVVIDSRFEACVAAALRSLSE